MDRRASQGMSIYWVTAATFNRNGDRPEVKGEVCGLDAKSKAIGRLQKVCSELTELHAELKESDTAVRPACVHRCDHSCCHGTRIAHHQFCDVRLQQVVQPGGPGSFFKRNEQVHAQTAHKLKNHA